MKGVCVCVCVCVCALLGLRKNVWNSKLLFFCVPAHIKETFPAGFWVKISFFFFKRELNLRKRFLSLIFLFYFEMKVKCPRWGQYRRLKNLFIKDLVWRPRRGAKKHVKINIKWNKSKDPTMGNEHVWIWFIKWNEVPPDGVIHPIK